MEKRKIYINDTSSNKVVTLETDATTFGQVKQAARQAGINIEGKDWLEGITKTSPVADDSLLPVNIDYKGGKTNDLIFVLTTTNNKIKSGIMTRTELYAVIKQDKDLQQEIIKKFGKNYTQVKTELLNSIYEKSKSSNTKDNKPLSKVEVKNNNNQPAVENTQHDCSYKEKLQTFYKGLGLILTSLEVEDFKCIKQEIEQFSENKTDVVHIDTAEIQAIVSSSLSLRR